MGIYSHPTLCLQYNSVDDSEGDVDLKFDDWDPEDGLGGQEQQTGSG